MSADRLREALIARLDHMDKYADTMFHDLKLLGYRIAINDLRKIVSEAALAASDAPAPIGLRQKVEKLLRLADAEVKACPVLALRCFQEGRVQMAQRVIELIDEQQPPAAVAEGGEK